MRISCDCSCDHVSICVTSTPFSQTAIFSSNFYSLNSFPVTLTESRHHAFVREMLFSFPVRLFCGSGRQRLGDRYAAVWRFFRGVYSSWYIICLSQSDSMDCRRIKTHFWIVLTIGFARHPLKEQNKSVPKQNRTAFFQISVVFIGGFHFYTCNVTGLPTPVDINKTLWHQKGKMSFDWSIIFVNFVEGGLLFCHQNIFWCKWLFYLFFCFLGRRPLLGWK